MHHTATGKFSHSYVPCSRLFVVPNFFREMSRIVDMWGTLDEYRYSVSGVQADNRALKCDYDIALDNIRVAMEEYGKEQESGKIRAGNNR